MKGFRSAFLIVFLFVSSFFTWLSVNADDSNLAYQVVVMGSDGSNTVLLNTNQYKDALKQMESYKSTENKVAVIKNNGNIIHARYAIVRFKFGRVANLYQNKEDRTAYTAIATSYGNEAAFIDYDDTSKRVKVMISGFTGWADFSDVAIVPISTLKMTIPTKKVRLLVDGVAFRKEASANSDCITNSSGTCIRFDTGDMLDYTDIDSTTDSTYNWYKVTYNGTVGWIASSKAKAWVEEVSKVVVDELETYYSPYHSSSFGRVNLIHYFKTNGSQAFTNLGPSPDYLTVDKYYYSFDGNYYYTSLITMLDDYRSNTRTHALNAKNPHYPYYMYLPNHSKTGYTADDLNLIVKRSGFTRLPSPNVKYVDDKGNFIKGVDLTGVSVMYNSGQTFIDVQNEYGVNALLSFSAARNESATGSSELALAKNNIFGHAAYDSCPFTCATTYASVRDSIIAHAKLTGNSYNEPTGAYFFGGHYGNKGSGMNVKYATDPYWGEKMAANYYSLDSSYGLQDFNSNMIGIKQTSEAVPVRKTPSDNGAVIYTLKNGTFLVSNMPLVVIDKVYTTENGKTVGWYKVYTDGALDKNQNPTNNGYNFSLSYGYIREDYLYLENNPFGDRLIQKDGSFYLHKMELKDGKLYFQGYLDVDDIEENENSNRKYTLTLTNENNESEYRIDLNAIKGPTKGFYEYSWFEQSIDFSNIKEGNYQLTVTATVNNFEATKKVYDAFSNRVAIKWEDSNKRGYQLRTDYYLKEVPIELWIRDDGLVSTMNPLSKRNPFISYTEIDLKNGALSIHGSAYNLYGDYSTKQNVTREIIFENVETFEQFKFDLGYIDGTNIETVTADDKASKVRAWYQKDILLSSIPVGRYAIFIHTKTGNIDDYDELSDVFQRELTKSITIDNKIYELHFNKEKRLRVELVVRGK